MSGAYAVVVVGTSWGGLNALSQLLGALPAEFPLPLVVVQHRSREATGALRELLQDVTALRMVDVEDKEPLAGGAVFLAPPDYHLLVEPGMLALNVDAPVRYSRPSIDVTFESAADAYGARCIGVVLTGANDDGARGLARIVARGGCAIVQAPETAESGVMPRAARDAVPSAEVLPIPAIAARLAALAGSAAPGRTA